MLQNTLRKGNPECSLLNPFWEAKNFHTAQERKPISGLVAKRYVENSQLKVIKETEEIKSSKHEETTKTVATVTASSQASSFVHSNFQREDIDTIKVTTVTSTSTVTEQAPTEAEILEWTTYDQYDLGDPMMVAEYASEIKEYLLQLEKKTHPDPDYMRIQDELTWKMRSILVDWIINIHCNYGYHPETLYLAINIMDRFLAIRQVSMEKLQLVGITALCIAAKYEEVVPMQYADYLSATDNGYESEELQKAERYVLGILGWDLSYPSPMGPLRYIHSKANPNDNQARTVSKYLTELTLIDKNFLKYYPSQIAAATTWFARFMLNRGEWCRKLTFCSGYTSAELRPIAVELATFLRSDIPFVCCFQKYTQKRCLRTSAFVKAWLEEHPEF